MTYRNLLIIVTGLSCWIMSCRAPNAEASSDKSSVQATAPVEKFKVGQVWTYDHRPGEDSSTCTILKIEKYEKGDTIVHIRIDGVKIYSQQAPEGYTTFIGHLPFSEKALATSVTKVVGQRDTLPDFQQGYNEWKEAWTSGKGGYFTVSLKEAVESVDNMMKSKQ